MTIETKTNMNYIFLIIISACLSRFEASETKCGRSLNSMTRQKTYEEHKLHLSSRSCSSKTFVGSNLFDGNRKKCFSPEEMNMLYARRDFEMMIPRKLPPGLLDDKMASIIMGYFTSGDSLVHRMPKCSASVIIKKAFCDTLGGFFHHQLLPVLRFSYYAGKVNFTNVYEAMAQLKKCRVFLNTNGNGWRIPQLNALQFKGAKIEPIFNLESNAETKLPACSFLDLGGSSNSVDVVDDSIIVSMPKIDFEDSNGELSNIWLPLSRKRIYNLRSAETSDILVQFYKYVSGCYKEKNMCQDRFDAEFKIWLDENLKEHLDDIQFYPGLAGILRIYETIKRTSVQEIPLEVCAVTVKPTPKGPCEEHWLDKIFNAGKNASEKTQKDKKKKFFNFGNWFKSKGGEKSSWWSLLKKILKYLFFAIIILVALYILYQLFCCCVLLSMGGGSSLAGNCFSFAFQCFLGAFKQFFQLLWVICVCICCSCCKRSSPCKQEGQKNLSGGNVASNTPRPYGGKSPQNTHRYPQPPLDNRLKRGKPQEMGSGSSSSIELFKRTTNKQQVGFQNERADRCSEKCSQKKSSRKDKSNKPGSRSDGTRLHGGTSNTEDGTSRTSRWTTSSQDSNAKSSWLTFYDP